MALVQGEVHYETDIGKAKTLCKRGKNLNLRPSVLNDGVTISAEKKADVDKLLQAHFGEDWRIFEHLNYFKFLIDNGNDDDLLGVVDEDDQKLMKTIIILFKLYN